MDNDSYTLQSVRDGARIAVTEIVPPEVRFCVQIAHGMVEFIDRYDRFATFLSEHGIAGEEAEALTAAYLEAVQAVREEADEAVQPEV